VIDQRIVTDVEHAGLAAAELDGAVALKAIAPGVLHKTEAGAVRLGLRSADEVRQAAAEMVTALTAEGHAPTGFVVQRMASPGVEMILGVVHDPSFGPVIACGTGGVLVELLRDVAVRLAPLGEADAAEMVRGLKTSPLLTGFRGQPARDVPALHAALVRLSALAEDLADVAELDCNPVIVAERGAVIVDARVRVEARTTPSAPAPGPPG
jgi:acyl-CoA synthetase (NDP forming)